MGKVKFILTGIAVILMAGLAFASPKALVVDYEMNPPVVLMRLLEDLKAVGFEPTYRPHYPRLTRTDLRAAALVILLSGDGPGYPGTGMTMAALGPLATFVREGGALILGPLSGDEKSAGGDHERYLFNLLLHRLGVPISIQDDWILDDQNAFAAPLYLAPYAVPVAGHPVTRDLGVRMVTDRSPSLHVEQGGVVLARTFSTAFPWAVPSRRESFPLVAMGRAGRGIVVAASRYLLTWGGGNRKEPGEPLQPKHREEEVLRNFLKKTLAHLYEAVSSRRLNDPKVPQGALTPPAPPSFDLIKEPLPETPPAGIREIRAWSPPEVRSRSNPDPAYDWIEAQGIRAGWAHINKESDELDRLAQGLIQSRMNVLWGVGFPQLLVSSSGKPKARAKLIASWERLAEALRVSQIRWFIGMEYPGRHASRERLSSAVGAAGRRWQIPSPWDLEDWRREVVRPAAVAAQWAKTRPVVAGLVVDLEMYGRSPLYFSKGVDFGDAPFRAFLRARGGLDAERPLMLRPGAQFSWLREQRLLEDYYRFLEDRAEEMGRELRQAVRAVHPDLILGCYSAGVLHRWFYRGLWRGMSEPVRPILLFTFQRDVELDLAVLRSSGIHALHARGLLMGMMNRGDYLPLFQDAISRHQGYWLNRLTSLVASEGFYPIEAPKGMSQEEAWQVIREANEETIPCPCD